MLKRLVTAVGIEPTQSIKKRQAFYFSLLNLCGNLPNLKPFDFFRLCLSSPSSKTG